MKMKEIKETRKKPGVLHKIAIIYQKYGVKLLACGMLHDE